MNTSTLIRVDARELLGDAGLLGAIAAVAELQAELPHLMRAVERRAERAPIDLRRSHDRAA